MRPDQCQICGHYMEGRPGKHCRLCLRKIHEIWRRHDPKADYLPLKKTGEAHVHHS